MVREARGTMHVSFGQHHELITAKAGDKGIFSDRLQTVCHSSQQHIVCVVTEYIVDFLEPVEIETQHREFQVPRAKIFKQRVELLFEGCPVGKFGQRIRQGKVCDLPLRIRESSLVEDGTDGSRSARDQLLTIQRDSTHLPRPAPAGQTIRKISRGIQNGKTSFLEGAGAARGMSLVR